MMKAVSLVLKSLKFKMEVLRTHVDLIFDAGLKAVIPKRLIRNRLILDNDVVPNLLKVNNHTYNVSKNVYVVGFGKAVIGMASAVDELLRSHIVGGVVNVPFGIQDGLRKSGRNEMLLPSDSTIRVIEGGKNNLPDTDALKGAIQILNLIQGLKETDVLIVLISGGGSALLPTPVPPITLPDKIETIEILTRSGANIQELNSVRQQMSILKGGGLARIAHPAQVLSLILSDIIGDPLEYIASGPTVYVPDEGDNALRIINKYNLQNSIPETVFQFLSSKTKKYSSLMEEMTFDHVTNIILGNNTLAVDAAVQQARNLGYETFVISNALQSEAKVLGEFLALFAEVICCNYRKKVCTVEERFREFQALVQIPDEKLKELQSQIVQKLQGKAPVCILSAGETTVVVKGKGIGGRNQELVLSSCITLQKSFSFTSDFDVMIMSAGTDGIDGATKAAGAVTYIEQYTKSRQQSLNPDKYLDNNDSHTFFSSYEKGKDLIVMGHTGTNVMDIQIILLVEKTK